MARRPSRKWTPKREAFAQAVASNSKSLADAYREAYDASKMSANAIHCEASKLMADPMVAQRVEELRGQLQKKALWSREMSVKALIQSFQIAKDKHNSMGMTGAVKELNNMHGFNAPAKVEHTGPGGVPLLPQVPAQLPSEVSALSALYKMLTDGSA